MSTLPVLEVAIGLSFTYLLLALIASTVTEWIARISNTRGKMLVQGLRQLVGEETKGDAPLTMEILSHPLIHPIRQMKGPGRYRIPSYIPADLFAKALMDIVHAPTTEAAPSGSHVSPRLLHALKTLQTGTTETTAADQSGVEQWYEQHMERVSGWYKRYTQTVILIIAVALTLFLDADTIHLASRLWSDSALRAAVLESAKARLQEGPPLQAVEYADPVTPKPTKPASDGAANHVLPEEQALLERMLGWSEDWSGLKNMWSNGLLGELSSWFAIHLLGWLITAFAISLGAPFWFDTLSHLMNMRSSGPTTQSASKK